MKLCRSCKGKGIIGFDLCDDCGGEGLDPVASFTLGKNQRRKTAELEFEKKDKKIKFDKKNASRLI